jgi:hypothetical protein
MHEDSARFREVDMGEGQNYTVHRDGRDLVIMGACPRCKEATEFRIKDGIAIGGSGKGLGKGKRPDSPTATVYCTCGYTHEGRPDSSDENGCGAFWKVRIRS